HRQARHSQLSALLLRDGCRRALLAYAASDVPASVPAAALLDGWALRNRRADRKRGNAGSSGANRQANLVGEISVYRAASRALPATTHRGNACTGPAGTPKPLLGSLWPAGHRALVSGGRPPVNA